MKVKNFELNDLYFFDFIENGLCEYGSEDENDNGSDFENDNESEDENNYNEWIIKYKYYRNHGGIYKPIIETIEKEEGILIYKYNKSKMRMIDFEDKKIYECDYKDFVDDDDESIIITKMIELNIDDDIKEELNIYKLINNESIIEHKKNKEIITELFKKDYFYDINNLSIKTLTNTKMYEMYNKDDFKISKKYYRYRLNDNELKQFKNRVSLTENKIIELKNKRQTTKVKEEIEQHKGYIESLIKQLRIYYNIDEEYIKSLLKM